MLQHGFSPKMSFFVINKNKVTFLRHWPSRGCCVSPQMMEREREREKERKKVIDIAQGQTFQASRRKQMC